MAKRLKSNLPEPLGVLGVPWCKGRVYVTAPKTVDAAALIKYYARNLDGAYVHRQIVPITAEEQAELDQFVKDRLDFSKRHALHSWVKIRRGVFVGDIAHVHEVDPFSDVVKLLVVPRLHDNKKRDRNGKREGRAYQSLFKPENAVQTIEEGILRPGSTQGSWIRNDAEEYLANGLRLITVTGVHYVDHYRPQAHELEFFTVAGINTLAETNEAFLLTGDRVKLVMGEFTGREGRVAEKGRDSVKVFVNERSEVKEYEVGISQLKRIFDVGDNIVAVMGPARNQRGIVVSVYEDELFFIDSETREEVSFQIIYCTELEAKYISLL